MTKENKYKFSKLFQCKPEKHISRAEAQKQNRSLASSLHNCTQ